MGEKIKFENYIEKNGMLTYTNVGVSMMPLLRQGKDMFVIEKNNGQRYKAGDVVLYRRPPDKYVLHRIVEVRPFDYVILGDNCIRKEYGIKDDDIIGIMTKYIRSGKKHSVDEYGYRAYSFVIMHTIPIRIGLKKFILKVQRILSEEDEEN